MRISKLVGERLKDVPAGVTAKSHSLLLRAGYIKQVSNGVYSMLPAAQKVSLKIQNIIREEMNKIGGQEVLMPVMMPREMWEKSGRYTSIGQEMIRFKDRNDHDMLLGMTHEEAAVHLCQNIVKSYDQLPFMIYQIQTKIRDEARPRAGLLRVKEFTMKDGYSFHTSKEDLNKYYKKVYDAYVRIYKRIGMKNVLAINSDNGMMGGDGAHEFQLMVDAGEDNIVICPKCDYKANMEIATSRAEKYTFEDEELKEIYTADAKTIDELCAYLKKDKHQFIKAVCYCIVGDKDHVVVAFIRGDKEINEAKLKRVLSVDDIAVTDISESGLVAGNIGCVNLKGDNLITIFDRSLEGMQGMICGANKEGYHYSGVNLARDVSVKEFVDIAKVAENDLCPVCGEKLTIKKGIEVGNIFKLGTHYSEPMEMLITMPDGSQIYPIMGCYGIGVGRCLAGVVEESADEKGIVWPMSIAPWHIYLCPLRNDNEEVASITENVYNNLTQHGFEVLYDDRKISAGVKLTDSELMGIPVRVVISPRSLQENEAEITLRQSGEKFMVKLDMLEEKLKELIKF